MSLKSKIAAASAAMIASVGIAAAAPSASAAVYRYNTYYTTGAAWLFAHSYDHRKTYLACGANKLIKPATPGIRDLRALPQPLRTRPTASVAMIAAMRASRTRHAFGRAKTGARARAPRPSPANHRVLPSTAPPANAHRAWPWDEPTEPSRTTVSR